MKTVKTFTIPIILGIILITIIAMIKPISNGIADLLEEKPKVVISEPNNYAKDYDFLFIQNSEKFVPYSYQELKNVFYSAINNGYENFTFYCPEEYEECLEDVKKISADEILLTHINNFTHPFNNYNHIKTAYYENGEVTLTIQRLYTLKAINAIEEEANNIIAKSITKEMNDEDKIKAIHDYIINNTKYDTKRNEQGQSEFHSNSAYGVFFEGFAICSGYSDAMAIFLEKLGFKNFKVASDTHVWNAVYINNKWVHLDLTWDDPVSEDGTDNLWHKYFLIDSNKFKELDNKDEKDHLFNKTIYLEFNDLYS